MNTPRETIINTDILLRVELENGVNHLFRKAAGRDRFYWFSDDQTLKYSDGILQLMISGHVGEHLMFVFRNAEGTYLNYTNSTIKCINREEIQREEIQQLKNLFLEQTYRKDVCMETGSFIL